MARTDEHGNPLYDQTIADLPAAIVNADLVVSCLSAMEDDPDTESLKTDARLYFRQLADSIGYDVTPRT